MNIQEMHIWFRMYAQQMGMQNSRGILPEQIDVCINTSISDIATELVRDSIAFKKDKEATNPKLYQINNLRNLYRVKEIYLVNGGDISFDTNDSKITLNHISTICGTIAAPMFYMLDCSVKYSLNTDKFTQYYPIRIVDDRTLSDNLNDAILAPRIEAPVGTMYNDTLDVYFGKKPGQANGRLNGIEINAHTLRVSYIETPTKVSISKSIDCNMIEALHIPILKHAVSLYNSGIKDGYLGTQPQQPQVQPQQSEN